MGVSPKKQRTEMDSWVSESKDRISRLPDTVLGRILSFLPTDHALATSVLSSRWKDLYKLATTLDFDDLVYLSSQKRDTLGFVKFVTKFLADHMSDYSDITKFRLRLEFIRRFRVIRSWIELVCSIHKIAEFELLLEGIINSLPLKLCHLMNCENLVVLKLEGKFLLHVSYSVEFRVLKVLHLKGVRFPICSDDYCAPSSDKDQIDHNLNGLLEACPLLEELVIEGCDWNRSERYFTIPSLRSLTFHDGLGPLDNLENRTIYMDLPNLVHLDYREALTEYEISNLDSISEVKIETHANTDLFDKIDQRRIVLGLLNDVCCCQSLHLSSTFLKSLFNNRSSFELPTFCNLTRLHLVLDCNNLSWDDEVLSDIDCNLCWDGDVLLDVDSNLSGDDDVLSDVDCNFRWDDVLWNFLESTTSLESLTLEHVDVEEEYMQNWEWNPPDEVPPCVKSHLKFINIIGLKEFNAVVQMITYFLSNATVREEMVIYWDNKEIRSWEK